MANLPPTPWTVDVTETGVYLCAGVEDVAEFRHSGRHGAAISQEEAVANATLAAAAPVMLQALKYGLGLQGGWREAIVELEDWCHEPVRLKNMLAAADQLDRWAALARSVVAAATRKLP